jgi:hypothetical protein
MPYLNPPFIPKRSGILGPFGFTPNPLFLQSPQQKNLFHQETKPEEDGLAVDFFGGAQG